MRCTLYDPYKGVLMFNDAFWCQHTFFANLLGTNKLSSTTMVDNKDGLSEVTSKNIIMVKLEQIPEEAQKVVEEHMKTIKEFRKTIEEEMRALKEKECKVSFLALRTHKAW
jgi:uncharacterized protein YwqG